MPVVLSNAVLGAIAGMPATRIAALAACGLAADAALRAIPSPGRCHYVPRDIYPVLVLLLATGLGIGVTGGFASPLLITLPMPLVAAWTVFPGSRNSVVVGVVWFVMLALLVALPASVTSIGLDRSAFIAMAAWNTLVTAVLAASRIKALFVGFHSSLATLTRVRSGALEDASTRGRRLERIGAKLAHELKNPLAAIKSLVQLEIRHATDDKSRRRLEVIQSESERMQNILREYLSFSRPADDLDVAEVRVGEIGAEVVALLAGRAEASGVELVLHGTDGVIFGDARRLKDAVLNLATNALEATARGGTVELRHHVGREVARIVVRDTGSGMSCDVVSRVGTPFFTTRDTGTGLGVVIARSTVVQHGGTLHFASELGRGTTATVEIPLRPPILVGAVGG